MKVRAQNATTVRIEISPRCMAWILAAVAGVWLFFQLRAIALLLVVALVFAGTFNPLVEWMERRGIRRIYALMLLFVALLLVTSLLIFLTVPPFLEQLSQIVREAPHRREQLIALLQQRDITAPLARALQNAGLPQTLAHIDGYLVGSAPRAVTALGWAVTTLFLSFYLLADGKRTQGALYAVVPRDYHMRLARILQNLEAIVGGYMRGQLITSVAIGVFTYLLLVICGVPNALSLALFAAVVDVIPFIGGVLGPPPAPLLAPGPGLSTGPLVPPALLLFPGGAERGVVPPIYR